GSAVDAVDVDYNTAVSEPTAPTKAGHTFRGWELDAVDYNFSTPVQKNITLVAEWAKNPTVSFDAKNGSPVREEEIGYETAVSEPTIPEKTGHTFTGWTLEGNAYNFSTNVLTDITLVATWTADPRTVTFNSNGGSAVDAVDVDYNTAVSEPTAPTKAGHTFRGWELDAVDYNFSTPVQK
ncbi:MAG: InlB B-repeat-containing protein, partial [Candidatus Scalindua sp.]|nr:InlB B-repeat-containing protein [Candidatus Scalindua sp.]